GIIFPIVKNSLKRFLLGLVGKGL
ncbi:rCG21921, partial [Rattus norvegicus]